MLECQFGYVLNALRIMDQRRASIIEVRPDAMRRFNDDLQARLRNTAWAGGCTSWYKTADGRVTNNWCGSVEDYKVETAYLRIDDYELMELTT